MIEHFKEIFLKRLREKIVEQEKSLLEGPVNTMEYYKMIFGHRKGLREAEELFVKVLREMLSPKDKGEQPRDEQSKYY
jgi:hypothetical protein